MEEKNKSNSSIVSRTVGPWMRLAAKTIEDLAAAGLSIIFSGPTGVGKEHLARIYAESLEKELTAINCAEFTPALISSELFGHVKGAFTGAAKDRHGILPEIAEKGRVLLLDEFQEMNHELQAQLLRVIETGKYRRVGSNKEEKLKSKIIFLVATSSIARMRPDILYRFDYHFRIPPLESRTFFEPEYLQFLRPPPRSEKKKGKDPSEPPYYQYSEKELSLMSQSPKAIKDLVGRISDLAESIEHCLLSSTENSEIDFIAEGALAHIYFRHWPGNFREMDKYIRLAVIVAENRKNDENTIWERDLPEQPPIFGERRHGLDYLCESEKRTKIAKGKVFSACRELHRKANLRRGFDENGDIVYARQTWNEIMKGEESVGQRETSDAFIQKLRGCQKRDEAKEAGILFWLLCNQKDPGETKEQHRKRLGYTSKGTYDKDMLMLRNWTDYRSKYPR